MPPAGPQGPYGPPGAYPHQPPRRRSGAGTSLIIGAVLLVLVLMVGGGAVAFRTLFPGGAGTTSAEGIGTVRHFTDLSADHVDEGETVEYDVYPPAGGPHYPVWQDCGIYEEPLRSEYVVHSQEHGAVWITYGPELSETDVQILHGYHSPGDYLVISPAEDLPAPVVASAWGSQIHLEDPADPRLAEYLTEYVRGENTPEPGAACSGGRSDTGAADAGTAGVDASEFTG
ncbi:DUF3105 domain-containing protein [Nocardiopsis quinghaiensis]|uniref:DUF3105 domain-containing protein n=1 Tax=Nocardiopsis quinghaiensis TaxID=464995 RepID=UPI00123C4F8C|nr:DUF3105 domain-containing protein [Nocardiopsis quinghaiensis]